MLATAGIALVLPARPATQGIDDGSRALTFELSAVGLVEAFEQQDRVSLRTFEPMDADRAAIFGYPVLRSVSCSAVLVGPTVFLTAQHCFTDGFGQAARLVLDESGARREIEGTCLLPREASRYVPGLFETGSSYVDVALCLLSESPGLTAIGIDTRSVPAANTEVEFLGYGRAPTMQTASPPLSTGCGRHVLAAANVIVGAGLRPPCGGGDPPRGMWPGDSGGPIVHQGSVIGISSGRVGKFAAPDACKRHGGLLEQGDGCFYPLAEGTFQQFLVAWDLFVQEQRQSGLFDQADPGICGAGRSCPMTERRSEE